MGFEQFVAEESRYFGGSPLIKITKSGSFSVNEPAFEKYFSGKSYAVLFHDKNRALVGIMPTDDQTEDGAIMIKDVSQGKVKIIRSRGFFRQIGKLGKGLFTYIPEWDEEHQMVVIDLKDPIVK